MGAVLLWSSLVAPLLAAGCATLPGRRGWPVWAPMAAAITVLLAGAGLGVQVLRAGPVTAAGGILRVDALSAFMLLVVGSVAVVATWAGVGYLAAELRDGHTSPRAVREYGVLVPTFLAAMVLAVVAGNLGVMWAAVEATTVVTAFLVGYHRTPAALEATWKYVMVGSVGVALALFGTVLLYFAAIHTPAGVGIGLNWPDLVAVAPLLDPGVTRLAAALLLLGFGTKAGLAPMHTWLPDAHSQAPAPVSALMSGVLLSVAFYALLRYRVIVDLALGSGFMRVLFVVAALGSLLVAASLMVTQADYKRLLAYSSIEHMGLVALGAGIGGPLATAALLLHMLGHGLTKAVLFSASGSLLRQHGTTRIAAIRGVLVRSPLLGACCALGLLALSGLPPFSIFASELAILRAGLAGSLGAETFVAMLLLLVIFGALFVHGASMLLGEGPQAAVPPTDTAGPSATGSAGHAPFVVGLAAVALLGLTIWPIERLLVAAAGVAGGGG